MEVFAQRTIIFGLQEKTTEEREEAFEEGDLGKKQVRKFDKAESGKREGIYL